MTCIADDSGLEISMLDGEPGIYSARFAKTNAEKLSKILDVVGDTPYRSARFHSVMVLCDPNGTLIKEAEGICWGKLLFSTVYKGGEFESLLWVREAQCTYGEFTQEQLSKLGSRGKAARAIAPFLRESFGLNQSRINQGSNKDQSEIELGTFSDHFKTFKNCSEITLA